MISIKRKDGTVSRTQLLIAGEAAVAAALAMIPELRDVMPVWGYAVAFIGLRGLHAYFRATTTQGLK